MSINTLPPPSEDYQKNNVIKHSNYRLGSTRYSKTNRTHEIWIDVAKVITMILVVIGHANYYKIDTSYGGINYIEGFEYKCLAQCFLSSLCAFIYSFHMPFFMALSGACFALSIHKVQSILFLIRSKTKRLLLPFLITTTFVSVPIKYISGYYKGSSDVLKDIIYGQYFLMGNSHLWFLMSLFLIFVVFYIFKKQLQKLSIINSIILLIISYIGLYLKMHFKDPFGFPDMLRLLLYFVLGYQTLNFFRSHRISNYKIILSWFCMIICWALAAAVKFKYLTFALQPIWALWGCFNMAMSCKNIAVTSIKDCHAFNLINKYNYELYLYSDPFNYAIIAAFSVLWGNYFMTDNVECITAFIVRSILTFTIALLIGIIVHNLKIKKV